MDKYPPESYCCCGARCLCTLFAVGRYFHRPHVVTEYSPPLRTRYRCGHPAASLRERHCCATPDIAATLHAAYEALCHRRRPRLKACWYFTVPEVSSGPKDHCTGPHSGHRSRSSQARHYREVFHQLLAAAAVDAATEPTPSTPPVAYQPLAAIAVPASTDPTPSASPAVC